MIGGFRKQRINGFMDEYAPNTQRRGIVFPLRKSRLIQECRYLAAYQIPHNDNQ